MLCLQNGMSCGLALSDSPITFRFLESADDKDLTEAEINIKRDKVRRTMEIWTNYAAIHFEEITDSKMADIHITFVNDGSWSRVGTACRDKCLNDATMNFGWIDHRGKAISAKERAVILHEFGHALGMLHEQQSPANGGRRMNEVEAIQYFTSKQKGWAEEMVKTQILETYNLMDVSSFSEVDERSIMHYPMPAVATEGGHEVPYNYDLSDLDKAYMVINYPKSKDTEQLKFAADTGVWTLDRALRIAGVSRVIRRLPSGF